MNSAVPLRIAPDSFLLALDAVREGVGPHFPIEARISGDDFSEIGLNLEDCTRLAKMIDGRVDLINVSCGNHEDPAMFCRTHPSAFFPEGSECVSGGGN